MSTKRYPRNIQRAISGAAQIEQQLANPDPNPNATPAPAPAPAPSPAPNPEPAPAATWHPAPAPAPAPLPQPTEDASYWKQRFQTVEGVLRTERSQHVAELRAKDQKISELETEVSTLRQKVDEGRDPASDLNLSDYFAKEQIELLGEEQLRGVLRGVLRANHSTLQKAIESHLAPLRQELDGQRQTVEQTKQSQAKSAYDTFLSELAKLVPNWSQINDDPRFGQFLSEIDDVTGFTRQSILSAAEQRLDHVRVARVFGDFLKSLGAQPRAADATRRLQPEGSPDGGNPPPDNRPSITQAEIRQFQQDVARGRYRGREKERAEMQKRIDDAYMSGRVA